LTHLVFRLPGASSELDIVEESIKSGTQLSLQWSAEIVQINGERIFGEVSVKDSSTQCFAAAGCQRNAQTPELIF
jgi:hypothetical protein